MDSSENSNNLISQGTFTIVNEVMIGGQTITNSETGQTLLDSNSATWTRNGSSLVITDDGETNNFSLAINGNTMTLSSSEMETEIEGTTTTTTTSNISVTFTKQ